MSDSEQTAVEERAEEPKAEEPQKVDQPEGFVELGTDEAPLDFVLVKMPSTGRFVRYKELGNVPAELKDEIITYEDLKNSRKEDLETAYSIITGQAPKNFKTQHMALENMLYHISKMRQETEPEDEPKGGQRLQDQPSKKSRAQVQGGGQRETRRSATAFELSTPEGLDVVKHLPPQARTIVEVMVDEVENRTKGGEHKGDPLKFTEAEIEQLLNIQENKDKLKTRQEPIRIFTYYRSKLVSIGILKEVR